MLTKHINYTGSVVAKAFLADFDDNLASMAKVMPRDYKAVLQKRKNAVNKEELEAVNG